MAKSIFHDSLMRVLSVTMTAEEADLAATKLLSRYHTVEDVVTAPIYEVAAIVGKNAAILLKLTGCVASRRETDAFRFGTVHTRDEIVRYFRAHFIGKHVESMCLMTFDAEGRALAMHELSDGTVNASGVIPRKLVEFASADGAASVVIAHNHPHGVARASRDDSAMTASLAELLRLTGVELRYHVLIAGHHYDFVSTGGSTNDISKLTQRI
jgi:DNA repair protein RadC